VDLQVQELNTAATEEYNGATWTSNPTGLNTARRGLAGCGTQTAALAFGGYTTAATGATEEYDGSTWTSNPTGLNTARSRFSRSWYTNISFSFWWRSPATGATEEYNGSTWATSPGSLNNTDRNQLAGAGTTNSCISFWW
jgi:hypothetical protein